MFRIVKKEVLSPKITLLEIEAPYIARKAQPGQFIIFRIDEKGERVPLTIGGYDREKGTITIIFQRAGLSTMALAAMEEGDALMDLVGPLGLPLRWTASRRRASSAAVLAAPSLIHRQRSERCRSGDRRYHRLPQQGFRYPGRRLQSCSTQSVSAD